MRVIKKLVNFIGNNISITVTALILTVASITCFFIDTLAGALLASALLIFVLVNVILALRMRGMQKRDQYSNSINPLLTETLSKLDKPVAVLSSKNTLVWYNLAFGTLPEARNIRLGSPLGDTLGSMLSYSSLKRTSESDNKYIDLPLTNGCYRVEAVNCTYLSKQFFAAILNDRSEYSALSKEIDDNKVHVAAISFDNSNEIKDVHDNYREISTKITAKLIEWAEEIGGIITEDETGKYLLVFAHSHLDEMVETKFEILDRVTEISHDSILPMTVSIGISSTIGTLEQKYDAAKAALNLAYQKGGSIAVLVSEDGENIEFGGRTKPVQSQSSIRSRICKDILKGNIKTSSNVLIFGHERPDYDSIASCIGLAHFAKSLGVETKIIVDTEYPGITQILKYISTDNEFDNVFISSTYGQELLGPDTLLVVSDVSNPAKFESPEIYHNANRVIIIDHHAKTGDLDNNVIHLYIDPSASSASELVSEICEFEIKQTYLGANIANLLLTGIMLDTDRLTKETGARTFAACRYLSKEGAETWRTLQFFKNTPTENQIITNTISGMTMYRGIYAIGAISDTDGSFTVAAAKAANSMLTIEGVSASFVLYFNNGRINISARSDHTVNVKNIVATLGGGGHFQSAGGVLTVFHDDDTTSFVKDMTNATELLMRAIDNYIDSLGEA